MRPIQVAGLQVFRYQPLFIPQRLLRCNSLYLYLVALCNWCKRFFSYFLSFHITP
nr:MAG TPA: hypothetical protein [Caudoviricetes sp.]